MRWANPNLKPEPEPEPKPKPQPNPDPNHNPNPNPKQVGYGLLDLFEANKLLARAAMAKPDGAGPEDGARPQHVPNPE